MLSKNQPWSSWIGERRASSSTTEDNGDACQGDTRTMAFRECFAKMCSSRLRAQRISPRNRWMQGGSSACSPIAQPLPDRPNEGDAPHGAIVSGRYTPYTRSVWLLPRIALSALSRRLTHRRRVAERGVFHGGLRVDARRARGAPVVSRARLQARDALVRPSPAGLSVVWGRRRHRLYCTG